MRRCGNRVWVTEVTLKRARGRKWLVLREENGLSDELIAWLEAAGADDVVSVSVGEEFRRVDGSTFVVHPGRKKEFERLVRELTEGRVAATTHRASVECGRESQRLQLMARPACNSGLHSLNGSRARFL